MSIGFEDGGSNGTDGSYDDARVVIRGGYVNAIDRPCRPAGSKSGNATQKRPTGPNRPPAQQAQTQAPITVEIQTANKSQQSDPAPATANSGGATAGVVTSTREEAKSASVDAPFKLPEFPFPPPDPSARLLIPNTLLIADKPAPTFGSVATRMQVALAGNGYSTLSYFAVPGGFVLVTYLGLMLVTLLASPLTAVSFQTDLENSRYFLAPLQALATAALGAFHVRREAKTVSD